MPNINEFFPSKYLQTSDFYEVDPYGKVIKDLQPIVTIESVTYEAVGQERDKRGVLYFKGKDKGFILNRTNANTITQLFRSGNTDDWIGQSIQLYGTTTPYGAKVVPCLRVKAPELPAPTPASAPVPVPAPTPATIARDFWKTPAVQPSVDDVPF